VNSCLVLAMQANGHEITTIEGLSVKRQITSDSGSIYQCRRCAVGLLHTGYDFKGKSLLDTNPNPSRTEIREAFVGNLCRCTGYFKIITPLSQLPKV